MLPKSNRIKKKQDFEKIFGGAKTFKNNLIVFKTVKNNLGFSRFAFIVSQKVSKKASIRNKTRRRLAKIIEENKGNIKDGFDSIIIALSGIEKKEFPEIKEALVKVLVSAKLIGKN